jgi:hypothetical protein
MPKPPQGLTVQFYVLKNVHWPMFEELCAYLAQRPEVGEIVVCLPDFAQLKPGTSDALVEELLSLDATITSHPAQRKADITFIADTIAGRVRGCGRIVNVGHGTISKGYYFTDSIWTERENWVDLLCVPGNYAKSRFDGLLRTRVVATGMPKLDPVFSGRYTRASLCEQYGIDPATRIVLYAPTFNEDLSSVYLFADRFAELAQDDRVVLIKLHGSTSPGAVARYRELAKKTPGVIFVDDPNIAPCLAGADLLVSDVSSVFMEFMALDKPIVLFNNPNMRRYHGFNPEDIEHRWRDLATETTTFDETKAVVGRVLVEGDGKSPIRQAYAAELFADRTGHAAERVWQAALETLEAPATQSLSAPTISLLVVVTPDNLFLVRQLLLQAQFYAVTSIDLCLVQHGSSPALDQFVSHLEAYPPFSAVGVTRTGAACDMNEALRQAVAGAWGDIVLIVRDDVLLYRGFDYFLSETFRRHPEVLALTGVSNVPGDANRRGYEKEPLDDLENEKAAYRFITWYGGRDVGDFRSASMPPMLAVRRPVLSASAVPVPTRLGNLAASGRVKIAPSVFYGVLPPVVLQPARTYLRAAGKERLKLADAVVTSGVFALFPDVAEAVLEDMAGVGASAGEMEVVAPCALRQRDYDLPTHHRQRAVLKRHPSLLRPFEARVQLLKRVIARVRDAGAEGPVLRPGHDAPGVGNPTVRPGERHDEAVGPAATQAGRAFPPAD